MNCIATQRKHCTRQLRKIARSGNRIPVQKYRLGNNIESATLKLVENIKFDFKGNLLESRRRFAQEYKQTIDWDASPALESETFATITEYDALNRATNIKTPHNGNIPASEVMPLYNEAGLLEKVDVKLRGAADATAFVENIGYNAKGQRERIKYGNGATTKYNYDENTFRLTRLLTTRNNGADILQDLNYAYDPVGNITGIADDAQQTVFFNGAAVSPSQTFEYDALYRLTKATGREHVNNGADTGIETEGYTNAGTSVPSDSNALRNYMRQWEYDDVGNILQLIHSANNGNWSRSYNYAQDSNRLNSTTAGQVTVNYAYNEHGSMTVMPHLQNMEWDFAERLRHVTKGTDEAYYNYDGSGQRVRKIVEKGNTVEERLYLGGVEVFRKKVNGNLDTERETLHVMDDAKRIALVETLTVDSGSNVNSPNSVIRYQFDNHLGSASLELDENAGIISYEEYYPYGDTSYQAGRNASEVSQKRYRYTGKEKDEESGLYYHGARYYACWLGRWTASDPIGVGDGVNLYAYCSGNPVKLVDPEGTESFEERWAPTKDLPWNNSNMAIRNEYGDIELVSVQSPEKPKAAKKTAISSQQKQSASDSHENVLGEENVESVGSPSAENLAQKAVYNPQDKLRTPTFEFGSESVIKPYSNNTPSIESYKGPISSEFDSKSVASGFLSMVGYASDGAGGFGEGLKRMGGSVRFTSGASSGNKLSFKHYPSGWQGGSRARITTYSSVELGSKISKGATVVSVAIGIAKIKYGWSQDGGKFGDNAKLETAEAVGGVAGGIAGGIAGAWAFAKIGFLAGATFGGLGAIPLAVAFGIAGGFVGSRAGNMVYDKIIK